VIRSNYQVDCYVTIIDLLGKRLVNLHCRADQSALLSWSCRADQFALLSWSISNQWRRELEFRVDC